MRYDYKEEMKFDSVEVTLAMGCILNCHYCPQGILLQRFFQHDPKRCRNMSFDMFKKVLKNIKSGGTICFSGMCEPFSNSKCADMIKYAYNQGFRIMLLTTLVGFSKTDFQKLENVVFDSITLHIPDEENNSKFLISKEYLENLIEFQEHFEITGYSCHGSIHHAVKELIFNDVKVNSSMIDRAGNLDIPVSFNPTGEIVCMAGTIGSYGNWTPEILPDGTVLLCCMDYGMRHILGNLNETTSAGILLSDEYIKIKEGMLNHNSNILCRKCNAAVEVEKLPAFHFKRLLEQYREGEITNITEKQSIIIEKYCSSENICVFGLGKLFWNNYFNQRWNQVLDVDCFSDNYSEFWGKEYYGIKCVEPATLKNLDNLLVIVHVSDDREIRNELDRLKAETVISIKEFYEAF